MHVLEPARIIPMIDFMLWASLQSLTVFCRPTVPNPSVSSVYGAVATPSELTIVTDLVKRGPLRSILDDKGKRESLTHDVRHKILKVCLALPFFSFFLS